MKLIKTVKLFYLLYSVYTIYVLLVSDYKLIHAFLGLVIIWFVYFLFSIGYKSIPNRDEQLIESKFEASNDITYQNGFSLFHISGWKARHYFIAAIFSWLAVIMAAKYYTGRSFINVITGIVGGGNAYMEYQQYFAQAGIGTLSLAKIPYILMLTIETIILYFGMAGITQAKTKITKLQIVFMISILFAHLYFGVARGTNFETYSVFILLVYCALNRNKDNRKINYKAIGTVVALGIIMVSVFLTVVAERGVDLAYLSLCPEIHLQSDRIIARAFPALTRVIVVVFSYLGYGIYEIGVTFYDIVLDRLECALGIFIPGGIKILSGNTLPALLSNEIDLGARWVPDLVVFIGTLGIPLFCYCVIKFGRFIHKLEYKAYSKVLVDVIKIFTFIELLSVPVGNFLTASTPNVLALIFIIFYMVKTKYNIRFFGRK